MNTRKIQEGIIDTTTYKRGLQINGVYQDLFCVKFYWHIYLGKASCLDGHHGQIQILRTMKLALILAQ